MRERIENPSGRVRNGRHRIVVDGVVARLEERVRGLAAA